MIIIKHRCNTITDLQQTPQCYGVEIDLRSQGSQLILQHDAFCDGILLTAWLTHYRHRFLILNVKEEGLEKAILAALQAHNISEFFFLDQSFPFLLNTCLHGEPRCAVRVSEYEDIATALNLAGKVSWVWLDTFSHFPLQANQAKTLIDYGFNLCLVSPELLGRQDHDEIAEIKAFFHSNQLPLAAVCTKQPELWHSKIPEQQVL